jgi:hypothetical protein
LTEGNKRKAETLIKLKKLNELKAKKAEEIKT